MQKFFILIGVYKQEFSTGQKEKGEKEERELGKPLLLTTHTQCLAQPPYEKRMGRITWYLRPCAWGRGCPEVHSCYRMQCSLGNFSCACLPQPPWFQPSFHRVKLQHQLRTSFPLTTPRETRCSCDLTSLSLPTPWALSLGTFLPSCTSWSCTPFHKEESES